jgi:hypothetical protein
MLPFNTAVLARRRRLLSVREAALVFLHLDSEGNTRPELGRELITTRPAIAGWLRAGRRQDSSQQAYRSVSRPDDIA